MELVNLDWNRVLMCTKLTGQLKDEIYNLVLFLTPNTKLKVLVKYYPCQIFLVVKFTKYLLKLLHDKKEFGGV